MKQYQKIAHPEMIKSHTFTTPPKTAKKQHHTTDTITAENLYQMSAAITIRALETNFAKSNNPKMFDMLIDAINFAKNPYTANGGDGAELIQETALYLWCYNGQMITDTTQDGQTDKDGNPITILRGAFRNIRKLIYKHEQKQFKQCYIEDYENENGAIAVPPLWDMPTYTDYITAVAILDSLELNANQKYILNKRLQGYSLQQIADTKNITKQAVANTLSKIGKKYITIYGKIAIPTT